MAPATRQEKFRMTRNHPKYVFYAIIGFQQAIDKGIEGDYSSDSELS